MNVVPIFILIGVVFGAVEASVKCENKFEDANLQEIDFQGWIRVAVMSTSEGISVKNILKWVNKIVPFFFEDPLGNKDKELIKSQMKFVEDKIGINFTELTKLDVPRHHLNIIIPRTVCNDGNAEWRLGGSIATNQSDDAILLTLYKTKPNQKSNNKKPDH